MTIIVAVLSIAIILLFYFVQRNYSRSNPNVFLEFQYISSSYYKILINDSLIIDSEAIKNLDYSNEHYKTKSLNLELLKGNYFIQIKDSKERVLSKSLLEIDGIKPKYVYLRKKIIIRDKPFILI